LVWYREIYNINMQMRKNCLVFFAELSIFEKKKNEKKNL